MPNQGIKAKKQIISSIILILVMILTFYIFLKGYSFHDLYQALKNARYHYLLAGFGMTLIFIICEAINIQLIMKVLGQPVSYRNSLLYSCIGFYFSSITPSASGGQPAQIYYMKQDKISITLSSITLFYVTFVYQIAMIILGIAAFIFSFQTSVLFVIKLKYLFIIGSIINTGAILLLFALMFSDKIMPEILSFLINIASRLHLIKNKDKIKNNVGISMNSYREKAKVIKQHPVLFFQVLFITIIQLLALSLIPFLVYKSMGYQDNNLVSLTSCQALLTISVSAIPLPGSEGITQVGFLHVFDLYFPRRAIIYAMLINRVLSFYLPLAMSFIVYVFTHIKFMKQPKRTVFD